MRVKLFTVCNDADVYEIFTRTVEFYFLKLIEKKFVVPIVGKHIFFYYVVLKIH